MKNLNKILLVALMSGSFFFANAQTAAKSTETVAAAPKGAMSLVDSFFKKYKEDGTAAAIDYVFGTNKLFDNNAGIGVLKIKLDSLRHTIGLYTGKDLIVQKNAGNGLYLYSFLVKHENSPLRFTFIFYKPKNDWVLYRFKYDDQLDIELIDAAKIVNKRP
jgi:hypothetical protein